MQVIQVKCWSEQEFLPKFQSVSQSVVRNMCFFGFQLDFVQIISPQFGQLVQLFFNAKNVDLSDTQNDSLSKILLK